MPLGRSNALAASAFRSTNAAVEFSAISVQGFLLQLYKQVSVVTRQAGAGQQALSLPSPPLSLPGGMTMTAINGGDAVPHISSFRFRSLRQRLNHTYVMEDR